MAQLKGPGHLRPELLDQSLKVPIDVVAEAAARLGIPVVLAGNDLVPLAGEPDLDLELERLAAERLAEQVGRLVLGE